MSSMWKGAVPDPYLNSILNKYQKKNITYKFEIFQGTFTDITTFIILGTLRIFNSFNSHHNPIKEGVSVSPLC